MDSFATKYPAFSALLSLLTAFALDMEAQGETLLQKLEASVSLVPRVLAFVPMATGLSGEVSALKSSPTDIESGVELLITDLAFSSDKAKAIIAAAFPLAEKLAALVPYTQALVKAIQG